MASTVTVSVIFYFTEAFKITTPDRKGHIENVIAQANIAFLKSEIPLKLSMKCMLETDLSEAPDSTDRIREFRDSQGEECVIIRDDVHKPCAVRGEGGSKNWPILQTNST